MQSKWEINKWHVGYLGVREKSSEIPTQRPHWTEGPKIQTKK
jgi:hypothetical protein